MCELARELAARDLASQMYEKSSNEMTAQFKAMLREADGLAKQREVAAIAQVRKHEFKGLVLQC